MEKEDLSCALFKMQNGKGFYLFNLDKLSALLILNPVIS